MERDIIINIAHSMTNKEDVLTLLNKIKKDEMTAVGLGDKFHPYTIRHINYYCNPNNVFHRYRQFNIKKKTGGYRTITTPRNKSYMLILKDVNEILKALYTPSTFTMGFTEGRSIADNANKHKGMNYVFNLDLKDFFPSIEQARVWKRLQLTPFNFPKSVANVIAGLCCMKKSLQSDEGTVTNHYVLPQGAPTSPIITNMICDNLDRRLAGVAKRFGLNYTRYADDITFSSMHNVYKPNGEFRTEVRRVIEGQGFTINEKKTRLQKKGGHQEVTGIVVSDKINVPKKYVRSIRDILYIWDKYGYNVAYSKFFIKYNEEKGHVKKGTPDLIKVISGKLQYLKMVKGESDSVWQHLNAKFQILTEERNAPQKTNEYGITYVETTSIAEFEKNNQTEIIFGMTKPKSWTGSPDGHPEQKKEYTLSGHPYAYFLLAGKKNLVSINKSVIITDDKPDKKNLAISSCRDKNDNPFWLIHRLNKVTVPVPKPVDIDNLNSELDLVLNL